MAVSVTQSLGGPFGARATRLGFFLGRPVPAPVPTPAADATAAGAAPFAGAVQSFDPWDEPAGWALPTVLTREGVVGLALGSPGGPRALSAVVQTITAWVDGARPLAEAVASARLHIESAGQGRPRLVLEGVLWSDSLTTPAAFAPWGARVRELAQVRAFGLGEWDTGMQYQGMSAFFGGVNAVARANGDWAAAADPRRDGVGRLLTEEDVLRAQQGFESEEPEEVPRVPPPSPPRGD
jgi:gamma-glutamyltranspeptidase